MPDEKLVDKLKKLKAHAESAKSIGNEEEAHAFAAMFQRLLAKHNLDMSQIQWDEVKQKIASTKDWNPTKGWHADWIWALAEVIADANNCRVLIYYNNFIRFIGTDDSVETCTQTMDYMFLLAKRFGIKAEATERKRLGKSPMTTILMRGFKNSYRLGFIHRLEERFKEEANKLRKEYSGCTALIRLSESLRLADDYIAKIPTQTKKAKAAKINSFGYKEGQKKADEINIGGPSVAASTTERPLLR